MVLSFATSLGARGTIVVDSSSMEALALPLDSELCRKQLGLTEERLHELRHIAHIPSGGKLRFFDLLFLLGKGGYDIKIPEFVVLEGADCVLAQDGKGLISIGESLYNRNPAADPEKVGYDITHRHPDQTAISEEDEQNVRDGLNTVLTGFYTRALQHADGNIHIIPQEAVKQRHASPIIDPLAVDLIRKAEDYLLSVKEIMHSGSSVREKKDRLKPLQNGRTHNLGEHAVLKVAMESSNQPVFVLMDDLKALHSSAYVGSNPFDAFNRVNSLGMLRGLKEKNILALLGMKTGHIQINNQKISFEDFITSMRLSHPFNILNGDNSFHHVICDAHSGEPLPHEVGKHHEIGITHPFSQSLDHLAAEISITSQPRPRLDAPRLDDPGRASDGPPL